MRFGSGIVPQNRITGGQRIKLIVLQSSSVSERQFEHAVGLLVPHWTTIRSAPSRPSACLEMEARDRNSFRGVHNQLQKAPQLAAAKSQLGYCFFGRKRFEEIGSANWASGQ